jgi:hypothetical protein
MDGFLFIFSNQGMKLPVVYSNLSREERIEVREKYIQIQDEKCLFCKKNIRKSPPKRITDIPIRWNLFPINFLKYPIHLQHDHKTGLTEGAVHNYCNAVMWQYYKR